MKCPKCGNEVSGKFCAECGTPLVAETNKKDIPVAKPIVPPESPVQSEKVEPPKPKKKGLPTVAVVFIALGGCMLAMFVAQFVGNVFEKISSSDEPVVVDSPLVEDDEEEEELYYKPESPKNTISQLCLKIKEGDVERATTTIKIDKIDGEDAICIANDCLGYKKIKVVFQSVDAQNLDIGDYLTIDGYYFAIKDGKKLTIQFRPCNILKSDKLLYDFDIIK